MYQTEISILNNILNEVDIGMRILEENEIVKIYNGYKKIKEETSRDVQSMINKMQSECKHPIWYHINTSQDYFEGRAYYMCKCLECGYQTERRSRDFNGIVIHIKDKFSVIQDKYFEFKKITNDINIIKSLLEDNFKKEHK